jgi:hypothetical protein
VTIGRDRLENLIIIKAGFEPGLLIGISSANAAETNRLGHALAIID